MEKAPTEQQIAHRHLAALWCSVRDALELLQGDPTLFTAASLKPLLRCLALDARQFSETLDRQLGIPAEIARVTGPSSSVRPTVLIIDDDPSSLIALSALLRRHVDVTTTSKSSEALELVRAHPPSAILTDLCMPEIDGLALLDLLRSTFLHPPPVLLMTASLGEEQKLKALEHGAFDYLAKPIDLPDLVARLRRAIRYGEELARERELQETDELTGLPNRRGLRVCLGTVLASCQRNQEQVAVALIDQDGLKSINDTFGHQAGDRSIVAVADALRRTRRASDIVTRLGGDEFAMVMPNTSLEGATRVLERLSTELKQPLEVAPGTQVRIAVSYGIAAARVLDAQTAGAELLAKADARMYAMKRERRVAR